ncbi:MAG TPA: ROK family transcriptional regulator [Phycisphaerae bacterium]|nr:ROK family transcriptional regulator [Phycisphaerales bacterium]HRX84725.1 ROK family transcriptional regulator [Phycisphaerae bacterium]
MSSGLTGTPPLVRAVNRHLILERVRRFGCISRAELAKITAIRPPTVSAIVRQLIDEGLIEEVGDGPSRTGTGRPPRMVMLSRRQPRVLGFEVNARTIRAVLSHLDGSVAHAAQQPSEPAPAPQVVERLAGLGGALLAEAGMNWSDLAGVGVALQGLVDPECGVVRWSRPFDWHMVDFQALCTARWDRPTDVLNNAVAGSLAEHTLGAGRDVASLIYIFVRFDVIEQPGSTLGMSVRLASGIIIHGEPYHGAFGAAGEITSLVNHPLLLARGAGPRTAEDTAVFEAALSAGEPEAVAAMDRVGRDIGAHVMTAINFLDPAMVIVDSDHDALGAAVLQRLGLMVAGDALRQVVGPTQLAAATLGEFGIAQGAAVPALARMFRLPRLGTGRARIDDDRIRQAQLR